MDKDWTTLPVNRRIYYTQVPSGDYIFKVRALVGDNELSTINKELKIEIVPPFYASLPAIFVYLIIGGIIAYIVSKQLHKQNEQRNLRKINFLETQKEREIYQAKIDFFTHVTHEIKTPLSLIKAPLEKVLNAHDVGQFKSDLQLVDRNTDRLLDLVDQLLSFRRMEIDGYSLNFNRTNISAQLTNICALFNESAKSVNIQLTVDLQTQLTAYVDQDAFNKIVSNLLSNAIKYAAKEVFVKLTTIDEFTFNLTVKNDGPILTADMGKRIFEPFVRSDIHSHKPGTGIGLPLAKALVDLHQGQLAYLIEDDQLNTFIMTIPFHQLVELNIGTENVSDLPLEEELPTEKQVILVVEDQKDFREFIHSLLSETYKVITAEDGEKAKKILEKHTVQLIVSDVMMPGIDGFELCRQLKNDINFSHIPFVILTAKDTFASKIEGLDCGSDAFIEKPFSPKHLKLQVANLLKNRDHIKHHYAASPLVHLKTVAHSKADSEFLHKLDTLIKLNLSRIDFDIEKLADQMYLSRPTLYRKVKAITNLSPTELVTITRLKQAAEMLITGDYKIYEIAEEVGFTSSAVLSRAFQKQFGMSPSAYIGKSTE
ncbi:hybrid sensor histidine kinase/response regulator transcription factor [Pedobacter frigiditerrae]|uniref:hybrid sensor histidine kinase/response regulator transcription factor n=1 Tax=Pedobacter frigiditerrae TaxID=2530452 RepID=UPI00292E2569|nr:hybrid sensor histidine kinase/response regulator transcription factor [Pedobacter frigiditerrae]